MFTSADFISSFVSLTKDFVADPTFKGVTCRLNTAGQVLDANGLGCTTSTSTLWVVSAGGFNDQRITAMLKWLAPTASGSEEIGVMARFQTNEGSDATYYYARVDGGVAKLTKVVDTTFTNLSTGAWSLPVDTFCTITLSVVGNALTATFHDETEVLPDLELSATDSAITTGGLMGFRSLSSTIACDSFTAEQL